MTEEAELQAESARIERLLADVRELVPLPAWQRIEDLLRRIVRLYAAGLERTLEHARASGAECAELDTRLCGDELVASLLVLHGLHPIPKGQRIERAIEDVRAELGVAGDALQVTEIVDGMVHVTIHDVGGSMSAGMAEAVIRKVIETRAPEIVAVHVAGRQTGRDPSLVQLRTSRSDP